MRRPHVHLLAIALVLFGCDRAANEPVTGGEYPSKQTRHALPNGEVSLSIRAVKDAIAEDRLDRAESLLQDLTRRRDLLSEARRAELERVATMIAVEKARSKAE